jgi:uncharacterized protein YbaP (TraB family)
MTPEQRARLQKIIDEYNTSIAAVNQADYQALDSLVHADEIIKAQKQNMVINKQLMDASRRANAQVIVLLNEDL